MEMNTFVLVKNQNIDQYWAKGKDDCISFYFICMLFFCCMALVGKDFYWIRSPIAMCKLSLSVCEQPAYEILF